MKVDVSAVKAGEKIKIKILSGRYQEEDVKPACEDKNSGHWYCVTHEEHFTNQFMKDTHLSENRSGKKNANVHVMAWICHLHGAEVP